MRVTLLLLAAALAGCGKASSPPQTPAQKAMLAVWTDSNATSEEKAMAVKRCYGMGTPVLAIAATLGPNYRKVIPASAVAMDGSPAYCYLEYTNQKVVIISSAKPPDDPLTAKFNGAGFNAGVTFAPNTSAATNAATAK